ncbi:MAG: hypothetical protein DWB47_02985 [Gammaproteobacteria bacterium]|nr:hypothetical protein [Gammaproteobacteria bacterium]
MAGQHAYLQRLVPAHFGGGGCHVPVVDKHWSSPGSVGPDSRLGDCPRDGSYAAPGAGIPDVHQPIPKTWLQPPAAFRQRRTGCSLRTSHYAPGLADDPDHLHAPAIRQAAIACCNITRRRHVYINFWYPIVRSEDLAPDIPQKVRVLGCDLVAFRDQQGQARVLSDTCTHRGASLGGAWSNAGQPRIINGCIVCPYHGWEFGGDGECKATAPSPRHAPRSIPIRPWRSTASCSRSSATCRRASARPCCRSRSTASRAGVPTRCWCSRSTTTTSAPSRTASTRRTTNSYTRPTATRASTARPTG